MKTTPTHKVDKSRGVRYANADKSAIDLFVEIPGHGSCPFTAYKGDPLFGQATAGLFGPIQSYVAPDVDIKARQYEVHLEFRRRVNAVLQGKSESMLREAMYLQTLTELTDDQKHELKVFKDINDWETAMVEKREELASRGDVVAAKNDKSWPKVPKSVTDEFLKGF